MSLDVLVVDDESDIRDLICDILKDEGFSPRPAASSSQALKLISEKVPSAIILDVWLQGSDLDGLGVLEIVKKKYPLMPVVIISGHGTIEVAVNAIKLGAYDYLEKPFTHDRLTIVLKRACEAAKLKRENIDLKSKIIDKTELIGNSSAVIKLKVDIEKVAPTLGRVMIYGETGSGKEQVARLIHKKSKRAAAPFIVFSPSMISSDKVMEELFSSENNNALHSKARRISVLEAANNGTLYIDEVCDLPISVQSKLLKFLQDQSFEKSTSPKPIKLDVRVLTSTSKNIQNEIENGRFRKDLYYRLSVVPLKVPSLAERKDDIPLLVSYFVKQLAKSSNLKERVFAEDTIATLQAYNWSGNIRQLRNVVEWALIMNPIDSTDDSSLIRPEMLPSEVTNHSSIVMKSNSNVDMMSMPLREAREVFERQYLVAQMSRFNNNISKTSSFVGMERSALHRKLKLLSIHTSKIKDEEYEEECV